MYRRTLVLLIAASMFTPSCEKSAPTPAASSTTPTASAPQAPKGTLIQTKVPAKGAKHTANETTKMSFFIEAMAGDKVANRTNVRRREEHQTKYEVLEANNQAPTKLRVTYAERKELDIDTKGNERAKGKNPVEGNTYIVERKGDEVVVQREDGKKVGAKEMVEVKKAERQLGIPDPFAEIFANHPFKDGETIDVPQKVVKQLFGGNDDMKLDVEKATLTFRGAKTQGGVTLATLDMKLSLTGYPQPELAMHMKLEGPLVVDTSTGWPTTVKLEGPITIKGKDAKRHMEMRGEGTMQVSTTYAYE